MTLPCPYEFSDYPTYKYTLKMNDDLFQFNISYQGSHKEIKDMSPEALKRKKVYYTVVLIVDFLSFALKADLQSLQDHGYIGYYYFIIDQGTRNPFVHGHAFDDFLL